jgi:hypothetical protein
MKLAVRLALILVLSVSAAMAQSGGAPVHPPDVPLTVEVVQVLELPPTQPATTPSPPASCASKTKSTPRHGHELFIKKFRLSLCVVTLSSID